MEPLENSLCYCYEIFSILKNLEFTTSLSFLGRCGARLPPPPPWLATAECHHWLIVGEELYNFLCSATILRTALGAYDKEGKEQAVEMAKVFKNVNKFLSSSKVDKLLASVDKR